jgi:hypothetical protein
MKEIVSPDGHVVNKFDDQYSVNENGELVNECGEIVIDTDIPDPRPNPNSSHFKDPLWHIKHAQAIMDTDPALYPMLYGMKGQKKGISLHPFESVVADLHQVFDCNRNVFKTITQVFNVAFHRGARDMLFQYIVARKINISPMTKYYQDHEREFEEEAEIARALDAIREETDKLNKGVIDEEKFLDREEQIIALFRTKKQQNLVKNAIKNLLENGEIKKSAHRLDMERKRREAKAKKIHAV